jgi:LAO/AO transport system kinase
MQARDRTESGESQREAARKGADLSEGVLRGDARSIARMITLAENDAGAAVPFLSRLYTRTGRAFIIGITGAPGAGKSTLVDRLAEAYRRVGLRVGIIAVDPTSPFSGGAILGDRIRMQSRSLDNGTFIRSMATRGHLGGLSRTTADAALILDAAGFEVVLIETVGVGQDEIEIVRTAHATVVLLVPGMGDDIQAMKAGIMEIGDAFVINKADHPGAERLEVELSALLSMAQRSDGWRPPIIRTIASEGTGIEACLDAVEAYRTFLATSTQSRERAKQVQKDRLVDIVRSELVNRVLGPAAAARRLEELAELVADRQLDPYSAADELLASIPKLKTERSKE